MSESESNSHSHPQELLLADRPYFVHWGRKTMKGLSLFTLLVALVVVGVSYFSETWLFSLLLAPLLFNYATGVLFFRNPQREIPSQAGILVSPADGKVVEVEKVEMAEYLEGPAIKIAIFLSVFDVHVNRSPGAGQVEYLHYRPGAYHDARSPMCAIENESLSIGCRLFEDNQPTEGKLLVRAISGAIARRIICPLKKSDSLIRGGLIGMIKYGSRAEIYLETGPHLPNWEARVQVGDRVVGGESILFAQSGRDTKNKEREHET